MGKFVNIAIKGQMGTTPYYVMAMEIPQIVKSLTMPNEIEEWKNLSIEEKWQRDTNERRVKKQIAPYFANARDRFTGSLIVGIRGTSDKIVDDKEINRHFKPVAEFGQDIVDKFGSEAREIGLLEIQGSWTLVPIDGQHRLLAFTYALKGITEKGVVKVKAQRDLGNDKAIVIAVAFGDGKKPRLIFSKVNRYARKTSAAEDLIMDDEDPVAVITRELTRQEWTDKNYKIESSSGDDEAPSLKNNPLMDKGPKLFSADLINIEKNSLGKAATEFTTLVTLNRINRWVLEFNGHGDALKKKTPIAEMEPEWKILRTNEIAKFWKEVIKGIDIFSQLLEDRTSEGDETRRTIREESFLGRPIGQQALAHAYLTLTCEAGATSKEACDRLNKVEWSVDADCWKGVLIDSSGTAITGGSGGVAVKAGDLAAYLAGNPLNEEEKKTLQTRIAGQRSDYVLPKPVEEPLPKPPGEK